MILPVLDSSPNASAMGNLSLRRESAKGKFSLSIAASFTFPTVYLAMLALNERVKALEYYVWIKWQEHTSAIHFSHWNGGSH